MTHKIDCKKKKIDNFAEEKSIPNWLKNLLLKERIFENTLLNIYMLLNTRLNAWRIGR